MCAVIQQSCMVCNLYGEVVYGLTIQPRHPPNYWRSWTTSLWMQRPTDILRRLLKNYLHDVGLKYPNTCLVDGQRDDRVAMKVDVTVYIV